MTIMIVDDNIGMRATIREAVQPFVSTVLECGDGSEAITAYTKYKPDWVLMDIVMKQMDGFTATKKILDSDPTAKIIIITQYNDSEYVRRSQQIGAKGFVIKERLTDVLKIINTTGFFPQQH
ncbi:MAG: response regulator transcription factor [Ignavibacteriae bacterium]|nr:response regulator transcription factor [Ignavibacteriota bacterium]